MKRYCFWSMTNGHEIVIGNASNCRRQGRRRSLTQFCRAIAFDSPLNGFRFWTGKTAGIGPVVSRVIHIIQPSRRGKIDLSIGIKNKKYLTGILSHSNWWPRYLLPMLETRSPPSYCGLDGVKLILYAGQVNGSRKRVPSGCRNDAY